MKVGCGRNSKKHAMEHFQKYQHPLTINVSRPSIWCYQCDDEIFAPENLVTMIKKSAFPSLFSNESELISKNDIATLKNVEYTPGVVGLQNLGNTCFMNSSLQCLNNCLPLMKFFVANYSEIIDSKNDLIKVFSDFTNEMWSGKYPLMKPTSILRCKFFFLIFFIIFYFLFLYIFFLLYYYFYYIIIFIFIFLFLFFYLIIIYFIFIFMKIAISRINPIFMGYDQQDAQEFLRTLIDSMHEALKKKEPISNNLNTTKKEKEFVERSIISDIFRGHFISQIQCTGCNTISSVREPFYDISLDLPSSSDLYRIRNKKEYSQFWNYIPS